MNSEPDISSLSSSIELEDALVDTKWFRPGEIHSTKPTGNKWTKRLKEAEAAKLQEDIAYRPFYARWYEAYKSRALSQRLEQYRLDEMQSFVEQKLCKINGIIADQRIKLRLMTSIVLKPNVANATDEAIELKRKYGSDFIRWVDNVASELSQPSSKIVEELMNDFHHFKMLDPLSNWIEQGDDFYCRMLERINIFASTMADMVKYSFIIEPGTITPHLSEYVAEFQQLETFFERNHLSPKEAEQDAFNRNCDKSRNKLLECADFSRVILQRKRSTDDSSSSCKFITVGRASSVLYVDDIIEYATHMNQSDNDDDFIHASYVRGGPLMNTFILTQAPLPSTINDFWQMVWQERSKYIIMLCKAVDIKRLGLLDTALPDICPYYWPRYEHDEIQYGDYIVCNHKIDCTIDPLFNVSHLSIRRVDDQEGYEHTFEHWQYDWNDFTDFYWPLRILSRGLFNLQGAPFANTNHRTMFGWLWSIGHFGRHRSSPNALA